jgi:hypothetical protein
MAPGSAALTDHPLTVNLREDVIVDARNSWIGRLFDLATLIRPSPSCSVRNQPPRRSTCAPRRRRTAPTAVPSAIAAGADPAAVIEPMNQGAG